MNQKIDRRKALSTMGKAAAGVGAVVIVAAVGAAAYEATKAPSTVTSTATSTATSSFTSTVTSSVSATSTSLSPQEKAQSLATAKPGSNFLIGYDTFELALEGNTVMAKSAQQACAALGITCQVMDAGFSVTQPIDNARTMIAAGAKGIITFGQSAPAYEVAQLCQQNNVFNISLWGVEPFSSPWATGDYFMAWVYQDGETDMYIPNMLQLEKLSQAGKTTGPVMNLQGDSSFSNAVKNFGLYDAWSKYPDMTYVGHQYTNWDAATATSAFGTQLAATPNLAGITAVNDTLSSAAAIASKTAGDDLGPYTVGSDGADSAITLASQNDFLAIGGFEDPYISGAMVCMLYDAITGNYYPPNEDRIICTNDFLITGDINGANSLASSAGLTIPDTYPFIDASSYLSTIYTASTYPYDWTVVSRGKAAELGKTWDLSGGVTVSGRKMGGYHSWYDAMGSDIVWSEYMTDCINRFSDMDANTTSDLSKAPFAPSTASPGVHSWNWYIGQPPTTPL